MLRRLAATAALVTSAVLTGCSGTGPAATSVSPALTIAPSTNTLTFASTTVGQTTAAQTFTFTNSGFGTLTLNFTISSTTSFTEAASTCTATTNLSANASCTLAFTFSPQTAGTFSETITLTDNVSASTQTLTLTGTGTTAVNPPPPLVPILTVTPSTTLTFPATVTGQTSPAQTFTFTNTGTGTLTLSFTNALTASFSQTSAGTCTAAPSLAANASCTLAFTFNPQAAGTVFGNVIVTNNTSTPSVALILTGTGTTTSGGPVLTIFPGTTLTFPTTTVGQTSPTQSFTFTNTGTSQLTLGSYALSGATTSFTQTAASTCTASTNLAVNASCTLVFSFTPQTTGALTETITATDNTASPNVTLTLTGTGSSSTQPPPFASLSPTSLTFPNTNANTPSAVQTVTLLNNGAANLAIASITISGTGAADFSQTNGCGSLLASAQSCSIYVIFTPLAASTTYTATLTVTDNSGNIAGSTQTVSLTGTSNAPVPTALAVFNPTTLTFPDTNVGSTSAPQTFTLSNPGTATLTGITFLSQGGTLHSSSNAAFPYTTTCGSTLAVNASCSISLSFAPVVSGAYTGSFSATDNAPNSPQIVTSTGNGVQATATLPLNYINFPLTQQGTTSPTQSITMTNNGNATLTGIALSLGGTNPTNFNLTTTCGTTLAALASCNITASFSPSSDTPFSAIIYVASSATTQPQQIALSGTGSLVALTHTLYTFGPDAPAGVTGYTTPTPLYTLINGATTSVDMTMYELEDATFVSDLIADCARGVKVRVILDASLEKSNNTPVYNQLNTAGTNCSAVFSNTAFQATHQKTITVDNTTTAIMSLNLQTQYYSTTRDFAYVENDPADIAAIEATFQTDYNAGTPYGGTQGSSDFTYQPGSGDTSIQYPAGDLIWSPTTAQTDMLLLIAGAGSTLILENEEMGATNIVSSLEADCLRGVNVEIVMVNDSTSPPYSSYATQFKALEAAGCHVRTYPDTTNGLYIHAKAVVADYGTTGASAYVGSINYSTASMTENRELGIYVQDAASITQLYNVLTSDYAGATSF